MKKMFKLATIVALVALVALMSISVFANDNITEGNLGEEVEVQTQCPPKEHDFVYDGGEYADPNTHTYSCTKCTATLNEPCSFTGFCGRFANYSTALCSVCQFSSVPIHNYSEYRPMSSIRTHAAFCTNTHPTTGVSCTGHDTVKNCMTGPTYAFKEYEQGLGHPLKEYCNTCATWWIIDYYNIDNHSISNCFYCFMAPDKELYD